MRGAVLGVVVFRALMGTEQAPPIRPYKYPANGTGPRCSNADKKVYGGNTPYRERLNGLNGSTGCKYIW